MLTTEPENSLENELYNEAYYHKYPLSITLELTPLCNMNCKMCYIRLSKKERDQIGKELTGKQWLEIAKQAKEAKSLFVLLTGGEPLLHPDFKEIYLGLKELGMIISINTNATLITEDILTLFKQNPPRRINISLYGTNDNTYLQLCGHPKGYTQTIQNIKKLKELGIDVKINYSLTPDNLEMSEDILSLSDELQIPVTAASYMFPPNRKKGCAYRVTPLQGAKWQINLIKHTWKNPHEYNEALKEQLSLIKEPSLTSTVPKGFLCYGGHASCWINWKGDMTACGMLQDYDINIRNISFKEAWEQVKNKSQQISSSNKCFHCRYRKICMSCPAASLAETGFYDKEIEYLCELSKEYERLLINEIKNGEEDENK